MLERRPADQHYPEVPVTLPRGTRHATPRYPSRYPEPQAEVGQTGRSARSVRPGMEWNGIRAAGRLPTGTARLGRESRRSTICFTERERRRGIKDSASRARCRCGWCCEVTKLVGWRATGFIDIDSDTTPPALNLAAYAPNWPSARAEVTRIALIAGALGRTEAGLWQGGGWFHVRGLVAFLRGGDRVASVDQHRAVIVRRGVAITKWSRCNQEARP